jgi:hypothetical protein
MSDAEMTAKNNSIVPTEGQRGEAAEAQRQWIETGTIPLSYLQSVVGATFSNLGAPADLAAVNAQPKRPQT